MFARLHQQHLAVLIAPVHRGRELAAALAVLPLGVAHYDAAQRRLRVRRIVLPELDAVHIVVGKPQSRVMQVIAALPGDVLHRKTARHNLA